MGPQKITPISYGKKINKNIVAISLTERLRPLKKKKFGWVALADPTRGPPAKCRRRGGKHEPYHRQRPPGEKNVEKNEGQIKNKKK